MEIRKLQATGGSSLTLTLPKSWTDRWLLKSKDEVIVNSANSSLIIRPAQKSKRTVKIEVIVDEMKDEWLLREIIGAYIAGADKITMSGSQISPTQNQAIRQAVGLLFGFEIFEETSQRIVARNVLDDARFSVSDNMRHVLLIARGMFEDALKASQTGDKELAKNIIQRDYEVNKLCYAINRQFNEILNNKTDGDLAHISFCRSVATQIERIGDHAVRIASLAGDFSTSPVVLSKEFPNIQERINHLFEDVELSMGQMDKLQAHQTLDKGKELERLIYKSKHAQHSFEEAIIVDSLDRLRGYLVNIVELIIDYMLSSPNLLQ